MFARADRRPRFEFDIRPCEELESDWGKIGLSHQHDDALSPAKFRDKYGDSGVTWCPFLIGSRLQDSTTYQVQRITRIGGVFEVNMAKRRISAKAVAVDIRSGVDNAELSAKYGISSQALEYLLQKLIENKVITAAEAESGQAPSRAAQPESRETPAETSHIINEPVIDPKTADAIVEEVRKGTHDYDIMVRLGLGRDALRTLKDDPVRQGRLSVEEVQAGKPPKMKKCPHCHKEIFEGVNFYPAIRRMQPGGM